MSKLFRTKNDLPERVRAEIVALLNQRLADAIDLQSQCKQAHWNVKGDNFIALHELFDKVNEDAEDYVDLIAERSVQLGGTAEGTVRMVAKRSLLSEYSAQGPNWKDHVEALSHALATFGEFARQGIESANTLNDADSADIFTEISRGVDKWLWMVEAHLVTTR
jgi:starvation-inducible DNA-binding protein